MSDGAPRDHGGPKPEGWYRDAAGRHAERWYSNGWPTELVRDGAHDGRDPLTAEDAEVLTATPLPAPEKTVSNDVDPKSPTPWWDTSVPRSREGRFDSGLDGAAGYEITRSARFANQLGCGPLIVVVLAALGAAVLYAIGFGLAGTAWLGVILIGAASWRLVQWTYRQQSRALTVDRPAAPWPFRRGAIEVVSALVIAAIVCYVVNAYVAYYS
jgi:hypothetical protein